MAVLEKIRSRMGILVSIIIGIALLAFVLTDFLTGGKSIFAGRQMQVAEINGEVINYKDFELLSQNITDVIKFQTRKATLDEKEQQQVHDQAWQQIIDRLVMGEEYDAIGLTIGRKELMDVMQGSNPHPLVRYLFTNPETKQFDRSALLSFGKSLNTEKDPSKKAYWLFIENEIKKEQILNKFTSLIKNGLYVTSFQAREAAQLNTKKVSFSYVSEKLTSISDSIVKLKESDLKKYYENHKSEFEQTQPTRTIEYITYDINPSGSDFDQAKKWIDDIKPEFEATTDLKAFVNLNSDSSYKEKYFKLSQLSDTVGDFVSKAKEGDTYGPYFVNSTFNIVRLADVKELPDSVKVNELVIRPTANTEEAVRRAEFIADSLKNVIAKGANFATIAEKYSDDPSANKGGDIGWIKEDTLGGFYNELIAAKKGDAFMLRGQTGFHVVQVAAIGKEVKKYQVAMLVRSLEPSSITIQDIYQKASIFIGNNNTGEKFREAIKKENINPQRASLSTEMREIPGIKNSRDLIRWAFTSEKDAISEIKQYENKFIIAHLTEVKDKGILPLEDVRENIIAAVKREKKIEMIKGKISKELAGASNIENLSSKINAPVQTANDITFSSYILPEAGFEPEVIAAAVSLAPNKVSPAIEGKSGVFVLSVSSVNEQEQTDPQMFKMRFANMYSNRANYVLPTLMKLAEIRDERIKFY